MPDPTDTPQSPQSPPAPGGDPNASRRRLLQGGLAAAPVLMTLVSRPVLAQKCTTLSGFVSANASTAGGGVACTGHSYEYWKKASQNQWPAHYKPKTKFNDVFNRPKYNPYDHKTLLDVLGLHGGATDNVARDIVCALLNADVGLTPVLSVSAVKNIWSEFISTGYFSPSSGAHWNANEIIAYLETTKA